MFMLLTTMILLCHFCTASKIGPRSVPPARGLGAPFHIPSGTCTRIRRVGTACARAILLKPRGMSAYAPVAAKPPRRARRESIHCLFIDRFPLLRLPVVHERIG